MRRIFPALIGLFGAAACAAPALAYEIDPLTRQPLNDALSVRVRPQAVETVAVPVANASLNPADPMSADAAVPQMSAIPRETVAYSGPLRRRHDRRLHGRAAALLRAGRRPGPALRRRRRPSGLHLGRRADHHDEARVAGLAPAVDDAASRRPDLPRYMKGGLENPLGARAMYLGGSIYRIHGSNEPETIGTAVSSGCIRMTNDDVIDLYTRAKVGTKVVVQR